MLNHTYANRLGFQVSVYPVSQMSKAFFTFTGQGMAEDLSQQNSMKYDDDTVMYLFLLLIHWMTASIG